MSEYQRCIRKVEFLIADELVTDLRCAKEGLTALVNEMFTADSEYSGLLSAEEREKSIIHMSYKSRCFN